MSVTQETLSQLLGVRRTTVTLMVAKLRAVTNNIRLRNFEVVQQIGLVLGNQI